MNASDLVPLRDGDLLTLKGVFRLQDGQPHVDFRCAGAAWLPLLEGVMQQVVSIDHLLHKGDYVSASGQYGHVRQALMANGEIAEPGQRPDAYLVDIERDSYGSFGDKAKPSGLTLVEAGKVHLRKRTASGRQGLT
ncbi:hypothetical protein HOU02_gp333 [Caulobacter phage CcrBL9]|uniref:Uncharacterized protein n=1 Tax=Caulobacter phage CcrBL9 TaxID=2283270 RepID=A0A385EEX2_9CAUD|nr:hypothetical protein HOU02_gp333 [Caulobacter phage CcrBL9]AXQ69392.1 hypothetical protein CcrBL9_gp368 [Caulobacter phage CcrBL9]